MVSVGGGLSFLVSNEHEDGSLEVGGTSAWRAWKQGESHLEEDPPASCKLTRSTHISSACIRHVDDFGGEIGPPECGQSH